VNLRQVSNKKKTNFLSFSSTIRSQASGHLSGDFKVSPFGMVGRKAAKNTIHFSVKIGPSTSPLWRIYEFIPSWWPASLPTIPTNVHSSRMTENL